MSGLEAREVEGQRQQEIRRDTLEGPVAPPLKRVEAKDEDLQETRAICKTTLSCMALLSRAHYIPDNTPVSLVCPYN